MSEDLAAPRCDPKWAALLRRHGDLWMNCLRDFGIDDNRASMANFVSIMDTDGLRQALIDHVLSRAPADVRDPDYATTLERWLGALRQCAAGGRPSSSYSLPQQAVWAAELTEPATPHLPTVPAGLTRKFTTYNPREVKTTAPGNMKALEDAL